MTDPTLHTATLPTTPPTAHPDGVPEPLRALRELTPAFAARAADHDASGAFVHENWTELKRARLFGAGVPAELGGGGLSHGQLCALLRELARSCPATALTLSMHQHLVAATVWKHRHGKPGEALLRRVADEQLALVSTGARDWLASDGRAERVPGGWRVSAVKAFASGSEAGDLLVTSVARIPDEDEPRDGGPGDGEPEVLHFALPFGADGIEVGRDWDAMGMRATGSHTVRLEGVFVPDEAVALRRPRGVWHPVWGVVLTVALPLIMAVYVGAAEEAAQRAVERARGRDAPELPYLAGELETRLVGARLALDDMVRLAADYDFEPSAELAGAVLARKALCAEATLAASEAALELAGGAGFLRGSGIERFVRDAHGARFHPLPAKRQQRFCGRLRLGLEPVG